MSWHYAEGKEQRGPVSEGEILSLIANGRITRATLVWRKGMSAWQLAQDTELFGAPPLPADAASAPATHRCIITGKLYPASQIIQTPDGPVSHEGKDLYYQSRREGVPVPVAEGVSNARADGKYVVVPVANPKLPARCVKTNAPVTSTESKHKTLYWYPPLLALTILLNLLIFFILYLIFRKKIAIDIPISAAGRKIVRNHAFIAWGAVLLGLVCLVIAIAEPTLVALFLLTAPLIIGGLVYGAFKATLLRAAKLRNGEVWLAGASREFVESLPRYS